jgi:predicted DNA-binding transcriptional regulator AlpA
MFGQSDDDFLIASEAAAKLRIAKRTLDNHRWKGTGPKFRRHGGRIVYRHSDLLAWSEERAARLAGQKNPHVGNPQPAHNSDSRHRVNGVDLVQAKCPQTVLEHHSERSDRFVQADQPNTGERRPRDHQSA